MATEMAVKKLTKEIEALKEEVHEIRRFLLIPSADEEGGYKKEFVKKILSRARGNGPFYRFADKEAFLKHVRSKQ
ncbi:MAG: hypothetical protein AAB539_00030 [Patescibacteria group bacterium]